MGQEFSHGLVGCLGSLNCIQGIGHTTLISGIQVFPAHMVTDSIPCGCRAKVTILLLDVTQGLFLTPRSHEQFLAM